MKNAILAYFTFVTVTGAVGAGAQAGIGNVWWGVFLLAYAIAFGHIGLQFKRDTYDA